jgi:phage-related holin
MHNTLITFNMDRMLFAKNLGWALVAWIWGLILPLWPFLVLLVWLVVADMLTGVWAAKVRKEAITSNAMRRTIIKYSAYFICVLSASGMEKVFALYDLNITFICALLACLTEFKSILENAETITGVPFGNKLLQYLPDVWKVFWRNDKNGDKPNNP